MSAYRDGDVVIVLIPARFGRTEEARWVERMVVDVLAREERARRRGPKSSDAALLARAHGLNRRYFDGAAEPATVQWVDTMGRRWGSCTPIDRSVRLSRRLRDFPSWVVDYVLVHELAHLVQPGHGAEFWALVNRFERTERARGYLEGHSAAAREEDPAAGRCADSGYSAGPSESSEDPLSAASGGSSDGGCDVVADGADVEASP